MEYTQSIVARFSVCVCLSPSERRQQPLQRPGEREDRRGGAHRGSNLGAGEARYRRRRGRPWEDAGILAVRQGDLTVAGVVLGGGPVFRRATPRGH
jgi:hypothetical protein